MPQPVIFVRHLPKLKQRCKRYRLYRVLKVETVKGATGRILNFATEEDAVRHAEEVMNGVVVDYDPAAKYARRWEPGDRAEKRGKQKTEGGGDEN